MVILRLHQLQDHMTAASVNTPVPPREATPWLALALVAAVAVAARCWCWRHSAGMFYGAGVEEANRLAHAYRLQLTFVFPPGQTLLGWLAHQAWPNTPYITRWLSLFFGLLTPPLAYLALRRAHPLYALGAAVALALSPAHLLFSITGVAEAIAACLVVLLALLAGRATDAAAAGGWRAAAGWSLAAVACSSAAVLTRFETWVLSPLLLAVAAVRFRRLIPLWILLLAAPLWWLFYSAQNFGGAGASTHLLPAFPPAAAWRNLALTWSLVVERAGWWSVALAAYGVVWPLTRRQPPRLALYAVAISGFVLTMIAAGKLMADEKYALGVAQWVHLFAGGALGAFAAAVVDRLPRRPSTRAVAPLLTAVFAALPMLVVARPMLASERVLWASFDNDRALVSALPALDKAYVPPGGSWLLATSPATRRYCALYSLPSLSRRLLLVDDSVPPGTPLSKVISAALHPPADDIPVPVMVVAEPGGERAPLDDLAPLQLIENRPVQRAWEGHGFRLYQVGQPQ